MDGLEFLGIEYDKEKNNISKTRNAETEISTPNSKTKVYVIPTDEERVFVEDVAGLIDGTYDIHTKFNYSFQEPSYRNILRDKEFEKECEKKPGLKEVAVNISAISR